MANDKDKDLVPVDNGVADNYDKLHYERGVSYDQLADEADLGGDKDLAAHLRARAHGGGADRRTPERYKPDAKDLDPFNTSPSNMTLGHKEGETSEEMSKNAKEVKDEIVDEADKEREEDAKKRREAAPRRRAVASPGHAPGAVVEGRTDAGPKETA